MRDRIVRELDGTERRLFFFRMSGYIEYDFIRIIQRGFKSIFSIQTLNEIFTKQGYGIDFRDSDISLFQFKIIKMEKFGDKYRIFYNGDEMSKKFIWIRKCQICDNYKGNLQQKKIDNQEFYFCRDCNSIFNDKFTLCTLCNRYTLIEMNRWYHGKKMCKLCIINTIIQSIRELFKLPNGNVISQINVSYDIIQNLYNDDYSNPITFNSDFEREIDVRLEAEYGIIITRNFDGRYHLSCFDLNGLIQRIINGETLLNTDLIRRYLMQYADFILNKIKNVENDSAFTIRNIIMNNEIMSISSFNIML